MECIPEYMPYVGKGEGKEEVRGIGSAGSSIVHS